MSQEDDVSGCLSLNRLPNGFTFRARAHNACGAFGCVRPRWHRRGGRHRRRALGDCEAVT